MRGILLAGGAGTRLYPMTRAVSKQLLPVYDKPLIYYPLSILMLAGIRDVLVVSTPDDVPRYERLLGDGSRFGLAISYAVQPSPDGIAQAIEVGAPFLGDDRCALILGDNIFYGTDLQSKLERAAARESGATVFAIEVRDPERYGVVELDADGRPVGIEEKPEHPRSRYAVTGLYFYDREVVGRARTLVPSGSGELEITDLNRAYLDAGALHVETLGRGTTWIDAGTHRALLSAANFVETIEERQGRKICCPEEIAFRMGYLSAVDLERLAAPIAASDYGRYLLEVARER